MGIRREELQFIQPGDTVIIEENQNYNSDAMKFSGQAVIVRSVTRNNLGDIRSIYIENDNEDYNWIDFISAVLNNDPIPDAAPSEDLMTMLFNT